MELTGGCYCGAVRYRTTGATSTKLLCYCRECQIVSGGGGTVAMFVPADGFAYTAGAPAQFARPDLETPVTREFCAHCGTHLLTRAPGIGDRVIVKAGTLDDPTAYGMPDFAIWTSEKQCFHTPPAGIKTFEKFPTRG